MTSEECMNCAVCLAPPTDAVVTRCGHLFCWQCLRQWASTRGGTQTPCPVCKGAVDIRSSTDVIRIFGSSSGKEPKPAETRPSEGQRRESPERPPETPRRDNPERPPEPNRAPEPQNPGRFPFGAGGFTLPPFMFFGFVGGFEGFFFLFLMWMLYAMFNHCREFGLREGIRRMGIPAAILSAALLLYFFGSSSYADEEDVAGTLRSARLSAAEERARELRSYAQSSPEPIKHRAARGTGSTRFR